MVTLALMSTQGQAEMRQAVRDSDRLTDLLLQVVKMVGLHSRYLLTSDY